MEAYVAQYLYATSKPGGGAPKIINSLFTSMIRKLVSDIDRSTGNFLHGVDIDAFYKNYQAALDYLSMMPAYSDEGWYWNKIDKNVRPFPNLIRLLL